MSGVLPLGCPRADWLEMMEQFDVPVIGMQDDQYGLSMEVIRAGMDAILTSKKLCCLDQTYAPHFGWRLRTPYPSYGRGWIR